MSLYVDGNKCQRFIDKTCGICKIRLSNKANTKLICSYFIEAKNEKVDRRNVKRKTN